MPKRRKPLKKKAAVARKEPHEHWCEWCGMPYEENCPNGPECEMELRDGYCSEECHAHKTSR